MIMMIIITAHTINKKIRICRKQLIYKKRNKEGWKSLQSIITISDVYVVGRFYLCSSITSTLKNLILATESNIYLAYDCTLSIFFFPKRRLRIITNISLSSGRKYAFQGRNMRK